ncbi:MAG: hypothetical protein AAGJ29_06705 [Pseudomonadota bacterium]
MNGRDALRRLDGAIVNTREALANAVRAKDDADTRRAEVGDAQIDGYRALAEIRLDLLKRPEDLDSLDRLHQEASDLLDAQDAFVEEILSALHATSERIGELEKSREETASKLDETIEAFETRVAEIEGELLSDPAYQQSVKDVETSASIVSRAEQKLEVARADQREKGVPYEADPLFSYLWRRKFRTPNYEGGGLTRLLDGWVARLCGYDKAHLNYARLTELPERIGEHLASVQSEHEVAVETLEAAEIAAMERGGALELKAEADEVRAQLNTIEISIEEAETAHLETAEKHEKALKNGAGPAQQARHILEQGLKTASFPDLRLLAAETLELEDDRIVDALVKLRAEEMSLELEAERNLRLPERRRQELETLERLRRRFKRENYDSPYATFNAATLDQILRGIMRGDLNADRALRQMSRAVKRRSTRVSGGFGGRRRRDTLGLPEVLGDVMWEIAKEANRGGSRSTPWSSRPTRRRAPPRSFPRSSGGRRGGGRKGGGFRTGGGF